MQFEEELDQKPKKLSLSLWARVLKLARNHWRKLGECMLMLALIGVGEALPPLMTRYAVDTFVVGKNMDTLGWFIGIYVIMLILDFAASFRFLQLSGRIEWGVNYDIRARGFRKLQELPFSYYDRMPVGNLLTRVTSDTAQIGEALGWGMVDFVWAIFFLLSSFVAMIALNWQLALAAFLSLPVLALISLYFQKKMIGNQRKIRRTNSMITAAFNEGIMGAKTTKTLVREDMNFEEFQELPSKMHKRSIYAAVISSLFFPIVSSVGAIATAYVLTEGAGLVLTGAMSLGTIAAFISYITDFFHPVQNIASTFSEFQRRQAAAERVLTLLDTEPDIQDTQEVEDLFGDNFNPRRENWPPIIGDIDFEDVSFKYKDGEEVLNNFNLRIKAGETIALVGATGAGKSTIVNLICRFYEPTGGSIEIDGADYRTRSQLWLQSNIGYVLQEPQLFSGTIADNIRYAEKEATDEQVRKAARLVNAETFILKLEKGYDTQVGEGGNRLSTGEKQLISFARAIIHNPRLFVLDEATSSVDTETEMMIQQAIEKTLHGRTSFIIAHRLSTIRHADRILVIEDGKIAESGSHKELIAERGQYYQLYTTQFREERSMDVLTKKN
ncbi:MAG: ABC transporter ATP-binding protein [Clostridiales bacterium]|nr:ABC transporter ATP-binding protein [Clostridiales bacterium]